MTQGPQAPQGAAVQPQGALGNWWDYNLKWVLIFGIAGAFVAYCFIGQYFLTTHPDYNVAVVSPYYLPEATVTALQEQLAAYGEDCNGDGKVVVKINQYTMASTVRTRTLIWICRHHQAFHRYPEFPQFHLYPV